MARRLISSTKSEIRKMSKQDLIYSIKDSEGRVVLAQNHVNHESLNKGTTNAELSEAMGADMIFFNAYKINSSEPVAGFSISVYDGEKYVEKSVRLKDVKRITAAPLGVYLQCGKRNSEKVRNSEGMHMIIPELIASDENLLRLEEEGVDFVVLGGSPGTNVTLSNVIDATRRAKKIIGNKIMICAGKWEDGGDDKVLGDPLSKRPNKEVIKELIDAGADVIDLPMPGARAGINMEDIRELVKFIHSYNEDALALNLLDGSIESSDAETIRQCAFLSKQTGADIHAIGDAGVCGMPLPENIYQMCVTIKGRRLTWLKMSSKYK